MREVFIIPDRVTNLGAGGGYVTIGGKEIPARGLPNFIKAGGLPPPKFEKLEHQGDR